MLIFDGDYPMAYGALDLNRDLTLPLEEVRAAEPDSKNVPFACLPEMRKGGVYCALMKITARRQREGSILPGYRGKAAAYGAAKGNLAFYRGLESTGEGAVITTGKQLDDLAGQWELKVDRAALPVGLLIGLEGADPILTPDQVHEWFAEGIRVVSLTHYGASRYAHGTGTGTEKGLLGPGPELLREMGRCGMLLDTTHISDRSFWEALEHYGGPILASHQNCRALAPGERQFSDEQLQAVIERDGVIGASMDTWMLREKQDVDWASTGGFSRRDFFPRDEVTLEHIANHVDHVCQLAGNALHAAIGGDTDGQGGVDGAPLEIDTVADYQQIGQILERRGYGDEDVANVMYRNWHRFYTKHLPTE
ncbi:MAG: peptidase M19 [Gemmatimonadetes bacterium]|nr:peptidase M19 [Gemmatimonadota bacterium]